MLKTQGKKIVDENGNNVILRGFSIGNWLMLEAYMLGFSGVEQKLKEHIERIGGVEKKDYFFNKLIEEYITEKDIKYIKSLGCNVVRIPLNYRMFESDKDFYHYKRDCFRHIDRVVDICAKHGIYVILDMHAAQGYQNADWHCDNYSRETRLFKEKSYRVRLARLWQFIAEHYKGNSTIAGYDLINVPEAKNQEIDVLYELYKEITRLIRETDKEHIIFIEGNRNIGNFDYFGPPFDDNLVYTAHVFFDPLYKNFNLPGTVFNMVYDRKKAEDLVELSDKYIINYNVPCMIADVGFYDITKSFDEKRKRVMCDLLDIFNEREYSMTVWSYKDIGNVGMVYPRIDTDWMKFIEKYLELKLKYRMDTEPVEGEPWILTDMIKSYIQDDFRNEISKLDNIIRIKISDAFSNVLQERFAKELSLLSYEQLDKLACSFNFDNCMIKEEIAKLVKEHFE